MKSKRLLIVFIALVMVCSVVLAGFVPAVNSLANQKAAAANASVNQNGSGSSKVTKLNGVQSTLDKSVFADGVLSTSDEMDAMTGVRRFSADEKVWVIVEMEGDSLIDNYNGAKKKDYDSMQSYVLSEEGVNLSTRLLAQQNTLLKSLTKAKIDYTYKYSYTSIMNGFAIEVRYGDISKISSYSSVKNVIVSEVYDLPQNVVTNEVNVYGTGIFNTSDCEYQGDGTVVAVLDTGIDYSHEVFADKLENVDIAMTYDVVKEKVESGNLVANSMYYAETNRELTVDDVWHGRKIPYSFDYADKDIDAVPTGNPHGVHVSGIIVGKSNTITGVAVNAQVCAMKVFSDHKTGAQTVDILAALQDSITLGVDVVNMSLGSDGGYQTVPEGNRIQQVYDSLREVGVSMIVAAGNSYNSYMNSAYGSTALTSNPDNGIMSSPASYSTTTAVASIEGVKSEYLSANDGETVAFFDNASNAASRQYDFYDMLEQKLEQDKSLPQFVNGKVTLEYITIPGLGRQSDYAGIDVRGKIALVSRGVTTFEDKAMYASQSGALAVIIYNNTTGVIRMSIGNALKIPACSINKAAGDAMSAHEVGTITIDRNNLAGPFMSDFSSWGGLPNLTLDPDITGHGGKILSSVTGGGYAVQSGTSMATPNIAGLTLLIREYLKKIFPEATRTQITAMTNQFMMSTATIANNEEGNPYSPRKQGAGLANLDAIFKTKAYLTVDGNEFTKLSLYDDPDKTGVFTLDFNLVNFSNETLKYNLALDVMTERFAWVEDYEVYTIEEKAKMYNDSKIVVKVNGETTDGAISVKGKSTAKISVTLTISEETKAYLANFENGTYVEGFARLIAEGENGVNLSIPYMGFYGNWLDAPMFDHDYYAVSESENDVTIADENDKLKATTFATTPLSAYYINNNEYDTEGYLKNTYLLPLGQYLFNLPEGETKIVTTREHNALGISDSRTYGLYNVYMGLLRGAKTMHLTINEYYTGKVIKDVVYNNIRKSIGKTPSFIYDATKVTETSELVKDNLIFLTEEDGPINNSRYQVTLTGAIDYKNGDTVPNNTFTFDFFVDTEDPVVTEVNYRKVENKNNPERPFTYFLDAKIYDNHYPQAMQLCTFINNQIYSAGEGELTPVQAEQRNSITTVSLDITDQLKYADKDGSLVLMVYDYAMNQGFYHISLPYNLTDCELKEEDKNVTLSLYEERTITPIITPADQWANGLIWTSSDESVVKANSKGVLYAVGEGTAKVTIKDRDLAGIKDEYKEKYGNSLGLFAPEGTNLYRNASRWDGEITIDVTVTNPENNRNRPVTPSKINLTTYVYEFSFYRYNFGFKWDGSIERDLGSNTIYPNERIKISYETEPWNVSASEYKQVWKVSDPTKATIDENGVMTALAKGEVTVTIEFRNKETDRFVMSGSKKIEISDPFVITNYVITNYYGFGDENGVVTLPDDTYYNAIGDYAFCYMDPEKLENPDKEAPYYYSGNKFIKKVIIPEGVESIGKYAFYDCSELEEVVLSNKRTEGVTNYLEYVNEGAFKKCTKLSKINIGKVSDGCSPVTAIGHESFAYCSNLSDFDMSSLTWIGTRAFIGCSSIRKADISKLATSGVEVFKNCKALKTIVMSASTVLGEYMFDGCTGLTKAEVPMTELAPYAFANCTQLASVNFNGSLDLLGDYAFSKCTKLKTVTFSETATLSKIGVNVFEGCTNKEFTKFDVQNLHSTLTTDDKRAIIYSSDQTKMILVAPGYDLKTYNWATSKVTTLGQSVFSGRRDIATLDLSASKVTTIEDFAFAGNSIMREITLPATLKTIGKYAFANCVNIDSITIPDGVEIGEAAFMSCVRLNGNNIQGGLQKVKLGKNVKVGVGSFFACFYLQEVELPTDRSVSLDVASFRLCQNLRTIDLTQFDEIPDLAFSLCLRLNADLSETKKIGAEAFAMTDGQGFYSAAYTELDLSKVEQLGDLAFFGNTQLKKVTLGPSLKVIPRNAFAYNLNLTQINLNYVEEIGDEAFFGNFGTIKGQGEVNNQSYFVFADSYDGNGLRSISLDNCKKIGSASFAFAVWLESVYAPVITEIGDYSFRGYQSIDSFTNPKNFVFVSELKRVDLGTTERDIKVGDVAFGLCQKLESINTENVTEIGIQAFYYDKKLTSLNLNKLVKAGASAISLCEELEAVDITSLKNIPANLFSGSKKLVSVAFNENIESIGANAIFNTAIEEINLTYTLTEISDSALSGANLKGFTAVVDGRKTDTFVVNNKFFVEDGMLYRNLGDGNYELICIPSAMPTKVITVKEGTQRVGANAAYANNNITTVYLPRSLKTIGDSAFDKTENLKTIVFQSLQMPVLEGLVDNYDFRSASVIKEFAQPNDNVTNLNAALGYAAFYRYYNFFWWEYDDTTDSTVQLFPVGKLREGLVMVAPTNGISYDNFVTNAFFNIQIEGAAAMSDETLKAKNMMAALPNDFRVTLSDEAAIIAAREQYNKISDATQRFLIAAEYSKLTAAERRLEKLKATEAPDPTPVPDEKDNKIAQLEKSASSMKAAIWVIGVLIALVATGFVLYVCVFSKTPLKIADKGDDDKNVKQ